MAESLISAMTLSKPQRVDPDVFKANKSFTKLDVVVNSQKNNGNTASKQNSIQKIASFNPTRLKNFSADILKSIAQRKSAMQIRNAIDNLTKEKVQATREQNHFTKNNPVESQTGRKINIST